MESATNFDFVSLIHYLAKLDSQRRVRRVFIVTVLISFTYTSIQAGLEFSRPDIHFAVSGQNYSLYGHGGVLFFFVSSSLLFIMYSSVLMLPIIPLCRQLRLPTKKIFYVYCGCLALVYLMDSIGSILLYGMVKEGLCIIDVTSFFYFAFYDGLVYFVFLHKYFKRRRTLSFKQDNFVIDYGDTNGDSHSSTIISTLHNTMTHNEGDRDNNESMKEGDSHFYPDNCVVMERGANIQDLMNDFYIMPEGGRMDYDGRPRSSTLCSEGNDDRSNIISLSFDNDNDAINMDNLGQQ